MFHLCEPKTEDAMVSMRRMIVIEPRPKSQRADVDCRMVTNEFLQHAPNATAWNQFHLLHMPDSLNLLGAPMACHLLLK
jgi:hypothetical protein